MPKLFLSFLNFFYRKGAIFLKKLFLAMFIEIYVMDFAGTHGKDAWIYPVLFQSFWESISAISFIAHQEIRIRQVFQQVICSNCVVNVPVR
jgi:hypothetical protein